MGMINFTFLASQLLIKFIEPVTSPVEKQQRGAITLLSHTSSGHGAY
jgi:hypothetical protein